MKKYWIILAALIALNANAIPVNSHIDEEGYIVTEDGRRFQEIEQNEMPRYEVSLNLENFAYPDFDTPIEDADQDDALHPFRINFSFTIDTQVDCEADAETDLAEADVQVEADTVGSNPYAFDSSGNLNYLLSSDAISPYQLLLLRLSELQASLDASEGLYTSFDTEGVETFEMGNANL